VRLKKYLRGAAARSIAWRDEAASAWLTALAEAAMSARWCRNVTHSRPLAASSTVTIGCTETLRGDDLAALEPIRHHLSDKNVQEDCSRSGNDPTGEERAGILPSRASSSVHRVA
jgi:hypothetical protein